VSGTGGSPSRWGARRRRCGAGEGCSRSCSWACALPGEDRSFGAGLFVDLVPSSCWFTNICSCVSARDWERLRRMITRRAGQRCEICGRPEDRETRRWLEAHERWTYHDHTGVQVLRRLICLCSDCHQTTHFGHAQITGHAEEALDHLRAVTGMTETQATEHIIEAFQLWQSRSRRTWALDLKLLTGAGVTVQRPPDPTTREQVAETAIQTERSEATPSTRHPRI
jgi:hypothetical protein